MKNNEKGFEHFPALHLDKQFCFSLYSLSRRIIQSYTPLLKPLDLTYPQYLVLLVLWQQLENNIHTISVSKLTKELKLDTGTVTPLLKRMENKDLLSRTRSKKDERIVIVELSAKGLFLREQAKKIPQSLLCQSTAEPKKVIELRDQLQQMLALLD
ncbi:MAG: DNA-binding MarR family transcriptional regulator [Colwellia sp.]|jgi:DNA-binding MarR family transcriptional regulator